MIGTTAEKIIAQIKLCLSHSRQITIRTDLWSTRCSNESFIGVTSHSYNPKMRKRQSFKLCKLLIFLIVSLLPALRIICIFKLRVISDSAANMIAGKYLALLYFILEYLELLLTLFLDHFF